MDGPNVRRGERAFVRITPNAREDLAAPEYTGGRDPAGGAYLFHLPFDIYVASDVNEPEGSYVEHHRIDIYPPFWNEGDSESLTQLETSSLPYRPGTLAPTHDKNRLKEVSHAWKLGRRANALRIDISPDEGPEFAAKIGDQFLGLIRWWTAQWWVKRDRRDQADFLRNRFTINAAGERLSGVEGFLTVHGGFGYEHPLDLERFQSIRGNITNGRWIPLSWDALFDAMYFQATRDLRRGVLELAIACEAKIGEEAERIGAREGHSSSKLKKALRSDDFTVQLVKGMKLLGAGDFARESPRLLMVLEQLRTARGNVAHGGRVVTVAEGRSVEVDEQMLLGMIRSSVETFRWLDQQ